MASNGVIFTNANPSNVQIDIENRNLDETTTSTESTPKYTGSKCF